MEKPNKESFGQSAQPLKKQMTHQNPGKERHDISEKKKGMAKKMKEGWHEKNLPHAKKIEGGGYSFSYKDLKK